MRRNKKGRDEGRPPSSVQPLQWTGAGVGGGRNGTVAFPKTDTEINRNLISVLQWRVICHGCWAPAEIKADQESEPRWGRRGVGVVEVMHLDKDATKQKDISKWKCLVASFTLPWRAPDSGLMLTQSSGSRHEPFLFLLVGPVSLVPVFLFN